MAESASCASLATTRRRKDEVAKRRLPMDAPRTMDGAQQKSIEEAAGGDAGRD